MKNERQKTILRIIDEYEISTQEALIAKLAELGVVATQTTVSRDIRQLKLVKGPTGRGTYKYVAPASTKEMAQPVHSAALTDSVVLVEAAQNIVVIKTHAGMANAIAVCIDGLRLSGIVGSVAGDDTMLLVVKNNDIAGKIEAELREIFHI